MRLVVRGEGGLVHVVIYDPTGEPIIAADIAETELTAAPMPRFALSTGEVSRAVSFPASAAARRDRRR